MSKVKSSAANFRSQINNNAYTRSLIEASLDPLVMISPDGKITDVNEATIKVTGVGRDDLIGTDFSSYFTESEQAREGYQQVFAKGFVTDYPLTIRHQDGYLVDVLYNASVYKDVNGEVLGVFAAARDVTESRRVAHDFEETKNLLDNILQSSSKYSIIGKDLNHHVLSWNEGAVRNYGYSADEVLGKNSEILHVQEDIESGVVKKLLKTAYDKGMAEGEFLRIRKDGSQFVANVVVTRRNDIAGKPVGYLLMSNDITEKKLAEEHARASSQYARSLIEASLDPLVTISPNGKITDVNEATAKVTGVARDDLIGTDFSNYFTQPDQAQEGYLQVFAQGFVTDYPLTIRNKDGRLVDVLYNASVYKDINGEVLGVFAAARDVTEQKQTSQYARSLIEASLDPLVTISPEGKITDVNEATAKVTGVARDELIGTDFSNYFTEPDQAREGYQQVFAKGFVTDYPLTIRHKDSRLIDVLYNASVYKDVNGEVLGVFASARDVTEQKQTSQYARSLIEASLDPLVTISPAGKITDVNEATAKVTGVERDELIGTDFSNYFTQPDQAREGYQQVFANGFVTDYPLTIRHKDNRLIDVLYNASVYKDVNGEVLGVFASARDVTEQKQTSQYARSLIEASLDPLVTISPAGKITDVNEATAKVTGVERDDLIGTDFSNYFTEPDQAREGYLQVFAKGFVTDYPLTIRHQDGRLVDVLYNASVYKDVNGEVLGVFASARDVTEQKHASQYARSLIEASLDPLVTISPEGKITDVNEATAKVTGLERDDLIGTDFSNYFTQPDQAREGYQQVFAKGFVTDYPLTIRHQDGHLVDVLYNASVYKDANGKVLGVFASARDVTEQKQTSQYARSLIEASLDPLVTISPEGKITDVNEATAKVTGLERDDLIGTDFSNYFTEQDQAREGYQKVFAQGFVTDYPLTIHHKDGRLIDVLYNASVYKDVNGEVLGVFASARDVTEQKQASQYARSLIEASLDPLVTISPEGKITDVNEATAKVTGLERDDLIGTDFSNYFTQPDQAQKGYQQVFAQGFVTDYPLTIRHKEGRLVDVLYNASVYKDVNGKVLGVFASARDVTEQKQTSQYARSLIEASLDPLVTISPEGKITDVNEATAKVTGVERDDLIGTDFSNYFTQPEQAREGYQQVFAKGFVTDYSLTIRHKDGHLVEVLYNASVYKDANGNVLGVFAAARDVTEQKQAEAEIVEQSKILERQNWIGEGQRMLSERMQGEQNVGKLSNDIITCLAERIGAQVGALFLLKDNSLKLSGRFAYRSHPGVPDNFSLGEGLVGQAAAGGKAMVMNDIPDDYLLVGSSLGQIVPKSVLAMPIFFEDQVESVIELASMVPLSDLHKEFLNSTALGIGIALQTARSRQRQKELLLETQRQSDELQQQQRELKVANEELVEQSRLVRLSEEKLKSQQEELQVTNEELEEKNELLQRQKQEVERARKGVEDKATELALASKYKSEFLANMSHELRTPLNSLLLLAQGLERNKEGNLTEEQVQSAQIIHGSGGDLLTLINDILDLSKIEAGKMSLSPSTVRVEELASRVRSSFEHMAIDKGLSLALIIEKHTPVEIFSDRTRVEQVIRNLMSNALKFTERGSVEISFGQPSADTDLSSSGLDPERCIAIAVKDTGIGIELKQQMVIFQAFQQADGSTARQYGGTGLGLSISRELAKLLGGEIQLASELGQGSIFTLYLPLAVEATQDDPNTDIKEIEIQRTEIESVASNIKRQKIRHSKAQPTSLVANKDQHIHGSEKVMLIIEDDPIFAKILYQKCQDQGFRTLVALTGESGLEIASSHQPNAIILDIKLPGIDGWSVLENLKGDINTRHIPVHIVSAEEAEMKSRVKGAIGYAAKPLKQDDVDLLFSKLNKIYTNTRKRVLVVEDDADVLQQTIALIACDDIDVDATSTGAETLQALRNQHYDCMVLDFKLPDMDGDAIVKILAAEGIKLPPIIVSTARDLTSAEEETLRLHAHSIIVKDVRSHERLLDEVSLFLHRVVDDMPVAKRKIIQRLNDTDELLRDKKILIVDDDMRTTFAMSRLLSERGMKPIKAENGKRALQLLAEQPDVELVLMDIMMPVMDGYTTMARIRSQEQFLKLPIIALTAKAMPEDRKKCIVAGASDYLPKPVDAEKLMSMMRVWLYR
ncbi:PAS domain S-box protein [Colwellia sp. C1TZA3]|uniref:PAS domain S-box protein n=1 Tax=Colwellia sp. C1TZA3 TaxID=2508879 RepID=UPI0011B95056|nr:PAS domain S-box protein [Colwellia sp. C1TZA3]TWX73507.1 PAS domain S-box protein [Colwellia sp. C1TZA3]